MDTQMPSRGKHVFFRNEVLGLRGLGVFVAGECRPQMFTRSELGWGFGIPSDGWVRLILPQSDLENPRHKVVTTPSIPSPDTTNGTAIGLPPH